MYSQSQQRELWLIAFWFSILIAIPLVACAGWFIYVRQYPTIDNPAQVVLPIGAHLLYRDPDKGVWSTSTTYEYTQVYYVNMLPEALMTFYTSEGLNCSSFSAGTKPSPTFDLESPYARCSGFTKPTGGALIEMQPHANLAIANSVTPSRRAYLDRILQPAMQIHTTGTILIVRIIWNADPWPL